MLVYKAAQVVSFVKNDPKDWSFNGRDGVTHSAKLAVVGAAADATAITIKAKTAAELDAKLAKLPLGKPAEIVITEVTPVFRAGDRKPSSYLLVA